MSNSKKLRKRPEKTTDSFIERLKGLSITAIVFAVVWAVANGLWSLDIFFVLIVTTLLIPIKLLVISFRLLQISSELEKSMAILVFIGICSLFLAFFYDSRAVPHLWAYKFGTTTEGTIIDFKIKSRNTHFVTYQFIADNSSFIKEQEVEISTYENLKTSSSTPIKYLSSYPNISYLADENHLKFETLSTLFLGISTMFWLYASQIKKWALSIWQNRLVPQ